MPHEKKGKRSKRKLVVTIKSVPVRKRKSKSKK